MRRARRGVGIQAGAASAASVAARRTSIAYSTWNRRPSGEKVLTPRSYSLRVRNMVASAHGRAHDDESESV